jgi:predicted metal-dependent enzyme (double-stranded beta helix superfamily)
MTKLSYKLSVLLLSALGGVLAKAIFRKIWQVAAREDDAPQATDARRNWLEILLAAALQGAIFAVVKASVDRSAAASVHKLTGAWPGDEDQHDEVQPG